MEEKEERGEKGRRKRRTILNYNFQWSRRQGTSSGIKKGIRNDKRGVYSSRIHNNP